MPGNSGCRRRLAIAPPGGVILGIFIERTTAIHIISEIGQEYLHLRHGLVTWYGCGRLEILQHEHRLRVGHLALHQFQGKAIGLILRSKEELLTLKTDGVLAFGIELHGVEVVIYILYQCRIGISIGIHFLAPAAPAGIHIYQHFFGSLLHLHLQLIYRCYPVYLISGRRLGRRWVFCHHFRSNGQHQQRKRHKAFHIPVFYGNKFTNNPCSFAHSKHFMIKIAVGVTGASGAIYAKMLLAALQNRTDVEVALVMSDNARTVWQHELGNEDHKDLPFKVWDKNDFMAPFASGSSSYSALIICPCSMGTLGRVAGGISNDLITRAADVMLKERRKLICVVRETPYNLIHIRNMAAVTEAGGIICPATPSFYSRPQTIEEAAMTVIHRVLQLAGIDGGGYKWGE